MTRTTPTRTVRNAALMAAATVMIPALAQETAPPPADGIRLLNIDDREYAAVRAAGSPGVNPDTFEHVVVFRGGVPTYDRGLADSMELSLRTTPGGRKTYVETGLVEDAWITEDETTAVIARSHFVLEREVNESRAYNPDEDTLLEARVRLEWIDLDHPTGRWEIDLGAGRLIENVFVLEGGHGVAVMTSTTDNADFRMFGRDRALLFEYDGLVPGATDIRATPTGGHLAVDLAFPQSAGLADRAVAVVDILRGENWLYTWNYGSEREPIRWVLNDDGTLTVVAVGRETVYGPAGRPVESRRHRR